MLGTIPNKLWLRVLTALAEDLSLVPSTHAACLTISCNPAPGDVIPLALHSGIYTYTQFEITE